jgi:chromosome segregation ATPase
MKIPMKEKGRRLLALVLAAGLMAMSLAPAAPALAEEPAAGDSQDAQNMQEIQASLEELAAALQDLSSKLGAASDMDSQIQALAQQLAAAKQALALMQQQAEALQKQIDALPDGAQKEALQAQLDQVKAGISQAQDKVSQAETALALAKGDISSAQEVAELISNLNDLTKQLSQTLNQMTQIISSLAGDEDIKNLLAQAAQDLKKTNDKLNETLDMAQNLIKGIAQDLNEAKNDPQLKAAVDALYKQALEALNNTNTTIADVDAIIKKANAILDQLSSDQEKQKIQAIINELMKEIQTTNNKINEAIDNANKAIEDANVGELSDETLDLISRLQTLTSHANRTLSKADTTLDDVDQLVNDIDDLIYDLRHPRLVSGELEIDWQKYGSQYTLTAKVNNGNSDVRVRWSTGETTKKITVSEDRLDSIWVVAYEDEKFGALRAYLKRPELEDVEVHAGNGCAYISWKECDRDFNQPEADVYKVKVTDESGEYIDTVKAPAGSQGVLIPNLMNDTRYDFAVTAESVVGESNRERVAVTPRATAPTNPSASTSNAGIAVYPQMLETTLHSAYLSGYSDGTVRPNATITRAETAAMFSRILNADMTSRYTTTLNSFQDVNEGDWYNQPVSTLSLAGLMGGRPNGYFDPNAPITRGEFAAIVSRMAGSLSGSQSGTFSDTAGHWAQADIRKAASLGWVRGYADGTYHPDAPITRAEACAIINRMTGRTTANASALAGTMTTFSDNADPSAWYYTTLQEAANTHYYNRSNGKETWMVY